MKKSDLIRIIKEEIQSVLKEGKYNEGDTVVPKVGPHKGHPHKVIAVRPDGKYNIQPIGLKPAQIKYK